MVWSNEWGKSKSEDNIKSMSGVDTTWLEDGTIIKTITAHSGKQITVTVVGDLGLDFDADGWNIYHLPSGACFDGAVPGYTVDHEGKKVLYSDYGDDEIEAGVDFEYSYDKQPLLNWMAKVQINYPTSWIMLSQLTRETYENSGKTAKEIIQKWCLSVKVE